MTPYPPAASLPYPRLRRFGVDVAIVAVFNVVIALVITYVIRVHDSLFTNLVISMCIGTLAVTFIDGPRLLLWPFRKPPIAPFMLILVIAMPAAQVLGNRAASLILGVPATNFVGPQMQNRAAFAVMFILICVGITWFFWNRERMEHLKAETEAEKARTAEVEKQAMHAQLQLLRAQIEPHMLFNTLANLQGLIAVDAVRAQSMLDQLIQYLRATLSASRAQSTTLAQEFALLDAFLGLMKVRMDTRLRYSLQMPDELAALTVPPMLLQPLVENAIKHGLEPKIDGGQVHVRAERDGDALILTVADTGLGLGLGGGIGIGIGPGLDRDALPAGANSGVGVSNVRQRLQAMYGERATFTLAPNSPCGTRAQIRIPL